MSYAGMYMEKFEEIKEQINVILGRSKK